MISLNDVLLAMSNIPVDDPIAEIWGRGLQGGYKIIEYTGSLPITINANGDALLDYRIYGAAGGVGDRSANLFNIDRERSDTITFDTSKYIYGARADNIVQTSPSDIQSLTFNENNFTVLSTGGAGIGFMVKVKPSTTYSLSYQCSANVPNNRTSAVLNLVTTTGTLGTFWGIYGNDRGSTFETQSDTEYVFIVFRTINMSPTYSHIMLVEGSTNPANYIPYGYKLPMTIGDGNTAQTVPVYIGENQLEEDEYVSYSDRKIYRMVDGTLTPTDPPVSLPEIPTIDGTTVIDYDGDPKPSQMYIKYKGKG